MRIKDASYFNRLRATSELLDDGDASPYAKAKAKATMLIQALASEYGLSFEEVHTDAINRLMADNTSAVRAVAALQPSPKTRNQQSARWLTLCQSLKVDSRGSTASSHHWRPLVCRLGHHREPPEEAADRRPQVAMNLLGGRH